MSNNNSMIVKQLRLAFFPIPFIIIIIIIIITTAVPTIKMRLNHLINNIVSIKSSCTLQVEVRKQSTFHTFEIFHNVIKMKKNGSE